MPQDNNSSIRTIKTKATDMMPRIIELLNEGHTVTMALHGNSMRPFLKDGRDKALLKAVTMAEELNKGDAVLAEVSEGEYVLHRIVACNDEQIVLLGDGNITPERCRRGDIRAIATGFYRKGRTAPDYTSGMKWKVYSWIWTRLRPIRKYLLKIGYLKLNAKRTN